MKWAANPAEWRTTLKELTPVLDSVSDLVGHGADMVAETAIRVRDEVSSYHYY